MKYIKMYENFEERIDVSCAALSSIVIDGKYLLFKEKLKYQPIGGGLRYEESALPFLESIGFSTNRTDKDIRITIPKKNWQKFRKWFYSGLDRETSIYRELKEELGQFLDLNLIDQMNYSDFQFIDVITDKYRIFQIHKIIPNGVVKKSIIDLVSSNKSFMLATKEEIENELNNISNHSKYIL